MIRPVIKKDSVNLARELGGQPAPALPSATPPPAHSQRVKLVRVGGIVRALEITCACGDTSVVELEYTNPTEKPR